MQNAANVTADKPKLDGAMKVAPVGTKLPTDAKATLDAAFKSLGYISEDGATNTKSEDTDEVRAWGGDVVLTLRQGSTNEYTTRLIESMNVEVLKLIYGEDNVTGTLDTGIKVKDNNKPRKPVSIVIETILKNDVLRRIVIPYAEVVQDGEINYTDSDATGFDVTFKLQVDSNGNSQYIYIENAGGGTTSSTTTGR